MLAAQKEYAEIEVGERQVRLQGECALQQALAGIQIARVPQGDPAQTVGRRQSGIEADRRVERRARRGLAAAIPEGRAEVELRFGERGPERDGFGQFFHGTAQVAGAAQRQTAGLVCLRCFRL